MPLDPNGRRLEWKTEERGVKREGEEKGSSLFAEASSTLSLLLPPPPIRYAL